MLIGFTSTSLRQLRDPERVVSVALQAGAQCIEWADTVHIKNEEQASAVRQLCEQKGIVPCSLASYYRIGSKNTREHERLCRLAQALGACFIRVWLGEKNSELTDEATFQTLAEDARQLCRTAEKYGLSVVCECHENTFNNRTDAFLKIKEAVGSPLFRTYFQSYYKDAAYDKDRIRRTAFCTQAVHISFWEAGRGKRRKDPQYIEKLLQTLHSVGFDGILLAEFTFPGYRLGFPSCLCRDVQKLREKVDSLS